MLDKDPATRITIEQVLEHAYLKTSFAELPAQQTVKARDPQERLKTASLIGKIFVKKLIDLRLSKKDAELV